LLEIYPSTQGVTGRTPPTAWDCTPPH
jgi:hypothetical protein